jgi:hypothetical protein
LRLVVAIDSGPSGLQLFDDGGGRFVDPESSARHAPHTRTHRHVRVVPDVSVRRRLRSLAARDERSMPRRMSSEHPYLWGRGRCRARTGWHGTHLRRLPQIARISRRSMCAAAWLAWTTSPAWWMSPMTRSWARASSISTVLWAPLISRWISCTHQGRCFLSITTFRTRRWTRSSSLRESCSIGCFRMGRVSLSVPRPRAVRAAPGPID